MSLFRKKETPAEEFLHVYTQVRQLCTWTKGDIPSTFRVGIQQSRAQQALIEWARENNPTIDYLSDIRRKVVSRKANKSEIKHAIARAQSILDDLDQRLAELGRRI